MAKVYYFFCAAIPLLCFCFFLVNEWRSERLGESACAIPFRKKNAKLLITEPRQWYFDLGLNNGESVTAFAGSRLTTVSDTLGSHSLVNRGSSGTWDIVGFEPNRKWTSPLQVLQKQLLAYNEVRSVQFFLETAAFVSDGNITFFHDSRRGDAEDGSTVMPESAIASRDNTDLVTTSDVARVLVDLRVAIDDYVIMKIDIEGAEMILLRHLIRTGSMKLIDELFVEWHDSNTVVFPNGDREKEFQHKCLDWMNDGLVGKNEAWGR